MADELAAGQFDLQVARFQKWAEQIPSASRSGEWECDYPYWDDLYTAWRLLRSRIPIQTWSEPLIGAFLYALARDNENRSMIREVSELGNGAVVLVSNWALEHGEPEAQYQCAEALGRTELTVAESLLLRFAESQAEYVRRMTLDSLAALNSQHTERLALRLWEETTEDCPWTRMMVLSALSRVGSTQVDGLVEKAKCSEDRDLAEFAAKLARTRRSG
jgi:hypothetical protein